MPNYIINKEKTDGRYNEVHTTSCSYSPEIKNRISLGYFSDGKGAVAYAKLNGYPAADGCYYCCKEANRG